MTTKKELTAKIAELQAQEAHRETPKGEYLLPTLRDQFAMATLTGLITRHGDEGSKAAAEISYRYADAMMKAREEK